MIEVTRLHGAGTILVNADLIETLEACPDTVITLVTRKRYVVDDSVPDIVERIMAFRRACTAPPGQVGASAHNAAEAVADPDGEAAHHESPTPSREAA